MATDTKDGRAPIGFNLTDFNSTTQLTEKPPKYNPEDGGNDNNDDDDYDPFVNRTVAKPNSTTGSLVHLLKSSLGSGILAMPVAFKNAGLLFGVLGTLIVGFICTHCVHILVQCSHDVCRKTKTPSLGFSETAEKVFENGPKALRPWSRVAKQFCDYGLMATYYSAGCVYIVFVANSFMLVINYQAGIDLDIRVYIAVVLVPCMLIGQIRVLKYLVPFSALANIMIVITFGITLFYMFNVELDYEEKPLFASFATLPYFFSTVIFAMEGIGAVMPVENQMKKPQHFLGCPGVLNTAMITVVVLYTIIGFFGYVRFGDDVRGSVTLNLPLEEVLATVGQILVALAILFTFGLQFYIPMEILWNKIEHKIQPQRHNIAQISIRTGIILIMGAVSMAVPKLEPFIGLVGAIFFSILGLFVPSVVQSVFLWPYTGRFHWNLIKNVVLAVAAVLALIAGSWVSIIDIIAEYSPSENGEH